MPQIIDMKRISLVVGVCAPTTKPYIKENKHLPGVPSAEEVVTSGIDMAKMDALLLQKIEELNLYVLQLEKVMNDQQQIIKKLGGKANGR